MGLTYVGGEPAAIERVQRATDTPLPAAGSTERPFGPHAARSLGGTQVEHALREDRGPALALGDQPDDREPRVRNHRLRTAELLRRLHGQPAHHVPRNAARSPVPCLLDAAVPEQHVVLRQRARHSQLALEQQQRHLQEFLGRHVQRATALPRQRRAADARGTDDGDALRLAIRRIVEEQRRRPRPDGVARRRFATTSSATARSL